MMSIDRRARQSTNRDALALQLVAAKLDMFLKSARDDNDLVDGIRWLRDDVVEAIRLLEGDA